MSTIVFPAGAAVIVESAVVVVLLGLLADLLLVEHAPSDKAAAATTETARVDRCIFVSLMSLVSFLVGLSLAYGGERRSG
jgi:hypothetical protein